MVNYLLEKGFQILMFMPSQVHIRQPFPREAISIILGITNFVGYVLLWPDEARVQGSTREENAQPQLAQPVNYGGNSFTSRHPPIELPATATHPRERTNSQPSLCLHEAPTQ